MSMFSTPVASPIRTDDAPEAPSTAAPPTPGRLRRALGWVLVVALLLGIGLLSMRFLVTDPDLTGTLNPSSPGPNGAKALAELVRDQGVDIEVTRSRFDAADALDADTTLVLTDPFTLTDESAKALIAGADHVVLLSTSARMLRLLDLGKDAPSESGPVEAQCGVSEFARVGRIEAERMFTPAAGVEGCFRKTSGASAVLRSQVDGRTITLVEAGHLLSNSELTQNGNAALGLALLAQRDRIVWYVPTFSDSDLSAGDRESLGDLTPEWVSPAILLLLIAGIAAIVWRGRRFGPLVAESLPVTVRAAETMQGRARLTAKAADAPHAGSVIRTGTLTRLAARLALSPRASVPEIADAASDRLRVPRASLYDLLGGAPPQTDQELIDLARSLAELETAVDDAVRTERNRP
jgi:hypothetical protein